MVRTGEVQCPAEGCGDVLQGSLSERLESMFDKLSSIQKGKETGTLLILGLLICEAIKEELHFPMLKALGEHSGWPLNINFEAVPDQIMRFKDEIHALLKNEIVLGTSFAWRVFVNDVTKKANMLLADFSCSNKATLLGEHPKALPLHKALLPLPLR